VRASHELDTPFIQPTANLLSFGLAHAAHRSHQRRLTQALLLNTAGIQ